MDVTHWCNKKSATAGDELRRQQRLRRRAVTGWTTTLEWSRIGDCVLDREQNSRGCVCCMQLLGG
ncbi:hypothetical protein WN943_003857 [Citrus x changshan-huyou]